MWQALAPCGDALDRAITLIFLRQLLDPSMPTVAGQDPRALVSPAPPWELIVADENRVCWLDALADRLNELLPEPLLTVHWETAPRGVAKQAVVGLTRWKPEPLTTGGDLLGDALQQLRPEKAAHGAFYTPYNVSYMMALITDPKPGESVCDPCCGSGRMLLAALQACREKHAGGEPVLYGVDIDAEAVRMCMLNLVLAGYGAARIEQAETVNGRRMLKAAGVAQPDTGSELGLTQAQRRLLAEVRHAGGRVYDGRRRKSIEALEQAGLVTAQRSPTNGGGRTGKRITVRPTAAQKHTQHASNASRRHRGARAT
jgi:predicted RNA methylase